jgi:hypothetical protein
MDMKKAGGTIKVDEDTLTSVIRVAFETPRAEILSYISKSLSFETDCSTVFRFSGEASQDGRAFPWSIILKTAMVPKDPGKQQYWRYWKREGLFYRSRLARESDLGLAVPRCFKIVEYCGSAIWIWLEDIHETCGWKWPLKRFEVAARHLGQFNGSFLNQKSLMSYRFLARPYRPSFVEAVPKSVAGLQQFFGRSRLSSFFPEEKAADLIYLARKRDELVRRLQTFPQTFCHMDAHRGNLFARKTDSGDTTVAIDWAHAGVAPLGADLDPLISLSYLFNETQWGLEDLDEHIFRGYIQGLRDIGWKGDWRICRFGYVASTAVRFTSRALYYFETARNQKHAGEAERPHGISLPKMISRLGRILEYVLHLVAEVEARGFVLLKLS